ncbi:hypothetical protein [Microbacterium binotii]|uniref:Uncharacterized protein n=1 Tax=Microbacterium binotii TaxID=462710 RepID=A0ABN3PE03_9MICO
MTKPLKFNYVAQAPKLTPQNLTISPHAVERWAEMAGVTEQEVVAALYRPRHAYFSRRHQAWCLKAGRIAVGVAASADAPGRWVVKTVLWATDAQWQEDARTAPPPAGRDLRPRGLR